MILVFLCEHFFNAPTFESSYIIGCFIESARLRKSHIWLTFVLFNVIFKPRKRVVRYEALETFIAFVTLRSSQID